MKLNKVLRNLWNSSIGLWSRDYKLIYCFYILKILFEHISIKILFLKESLHRLSLQFLAWRKEPFVPCALLTLEIFERLEYLYDACVKNVELLIISITFCCVSAHSIFVTLKQEPYFSLLFCSLANGAGLSWAFC